MGLNLFPLIECRESYDLSTGKCRRSFVSCFFKTTTNVLSWFLLLLALTSQPSFILTTGFQLPTIGIEGLNLFTKFVWSSTLLIHLAVNRSKIRSLVTSINNLIINEFVIRKKLAAISRTAFAIFAVFMVAEVIGIYKINTTIGGFHFFRMYSVTVFVERMVRNGWIKWTINGTEIDCQTFSFFNHYKAEYPTISLIHGWFQHFFHLCFMTGSLYMFAVLVTFLEVAMSKIYIWKLSELKNMIRSRSYPSLDNEWQDVIICDMRSVRVKIQAMRLQCDHIFSLPILISLSLLFLDTGIRLSIKQIKLTGREESLKQHIFWFGIMFHIMKSLAHVLLIIFLDNVYEEADAAEIDIVNSMIDSFKDKHGHLSSVSTFRGHREKMEFNRKSLNSIQLMILEMMNNKLHRLTAWNMFIVQKSVILAFLGSVIPFAVIVVGFFTPDQN